MPPAAADIHHGEQELGIRKEFDKNLKTSKKWAPLLLSGVGDSVTQFTNVEYPKSIRNIDRFYKLNSQTFPNKMKSEMGGVLLCRNFQAIKPGW